MIYIQSARNDTSTNDVLDWLFYFGREDVTRSNDEDFIEKVSIHINEASTFIKAKGEKQNFHDIDRFWYRRGHNRINPWVNIVEVPSGKIPLYLEAELSPVLEHLDSLFGNAKVCINKYDDNKTNKIRNLVLAKAAGLVVPETLVTNDPSELNSFLKRFQKVITKPFTQNSFSFRISNYKVYISSTTAIMTPIVEHPKSEKMLPSLFQQYVEKKYELRIFYLNGDFYAMAIFSQADRLTRLDFRNYNPTSPNRCAPFKLPDCIKAKLHNFMVSAELNCGSIDMICSPDGAYVFLEVNPVGQYQWLERNCNYFISKHVAELLAC